MNVGITGTGLTPSSQNNLKKILDDSGIEHFQIGSKSKIKKLDCIIVLGEIEVLGIIFIEHLMQLYLF